MYDFLVITDGADNQKELLLDGNGSPLRKESPYELSVGVAYHQISLRTHYTSGVRQCEEMFIRWNNNEYFPYPGDMILSRAHKNTLLECKIKAYTEFDRVISGRTHPLREFFRDVLGWTDPMEQFGITISLSGQSCAIKKRKVSLSCILR